MKHNAPNDVANGTRTGKIRDRYTEKDEGTASTFIAQVTPDTIDRRDVAKIVDAIFELQN